MEPVMPAWAWPGMSHRNVMPAAGTVIEPVTVLPGSAVILVPSANVRLCCNAPSLTNVTEKVPAEATDRAFGRKPRSKAWISRVEPAALTVDAAADELDAVDPVMP